MLYSPVAQSRSQLARSVSAQAPNRGPHLTTQQLAGYFDWPTQKVRRWLQNTGAGEKRGGLYVTTFEKLRKHWPEAYGEVVMRSMGE